MEKQIRETMQIDWGNGLPLNGLVKAHESCLQYPDLQGCDAVDAQMADIAVSLATCTADTRSLLCQTFVKGVGEHALAGMLPRAEPLTLPSWPLYWKLPTAALQAQAGKFGYRSEVAARWWETWRTTITSSLALLSMSIFCWVGVSAREKEKQERATQLAQQLRAQAEHERIRHVQQERTRAEFERQAKLAHEAAVKEQRRLAAAEAAKRKADEAAAKLAAEQAEAAQLLQSMFNPVSPTRGNHGNPTE